MISFTGDFDADGRIDLIVAGEDGPLLLWNLGGGMFQEVVSESGELAYRFYPYITGGALCDINNDGLQDLLLQYPAMRPQVFFNRGFRCFGYAEQLEPADEAPYADAFFEGQQGVAVGDLNGDGAQDMALVSRNGQLWIMFRDTSKGDNLGVTVIVEGSAGPVTVTASDGKRALGAQAVSVATPGFFGKLNRGPLNLEWQFPGGKKQSRQVVVLKPEQVTLRPSDE